MNRTAILRRANAAKLHAVFRLLPLQKQLRRLISHEKQLAYEQFFNPPKRRWAPILTSIGLIGGLAGAVGWYFFWPHHTFSTPVAKILRKALWAESNKENDYMKALKLYIESLELADEENLDHLSDEYTGIQLKIAEMYEKLDMATEASLVYMEICNGYLAGLNSGEVPLENRSHVIQKDLRVAHKFAHLNKDKMDGLKFFLLEHLLKAQEEVLLKISGQETNLKNTNDAFLNADVTKTLSPHHREVKAGDPKLVVLVSKDEAYYNMPEYRFAWMPFRDEFFNLRDLFITICLASGDGELACQTQVATTRWMIAAGCDFKYLLNSFADCGALLYLSAELLEFEASEAKKLGDEALAAAKVEKQDVALKMAADWYDMVLLCAKLLPGSFVRSHDEITKAMALATYSLGVISLHKGEYTEAKELLRQARIRAKSVEADDIVKESESELEKLEKEQVQLAGGKKKTLSGFEMTYELLKQDN